MLNITILKNNHRTPDLENAIVLNHQHGTPIPKYLHGSYMQVARSEYEVVKYLSEHPNTPVIVENQPGWENLSEDDYQLELVRKAFPNGLPKKFNQLSKVQKDFLIFFGSDRIAFYLKIIPKTYPDNTFFIDNENLFLKKYNLNSRNDYIGNNVKDIRKTIAVDNGREYITLKNAICIANESGSSEIIIVYGASHYFKDVAKCFMNIKLNFVDFYYRDPQNMNEQKRQHTLKIMEDIKQQEPNCEMIDRILYTHPKVIDSCIPVQTKTIDSQLSLGNDNSQQSNMNNTYSIGTVALIGVMVYGLFNCCRKLKNPLTTSVESENVEVNNGNDERPHFE